MRWLRFGSWPSTHDLDLMLDGDYRILDQLCPYPDDVQEAALAPRMVVDAESIPLPTDLIEQAIEAAQGLPLDLFLYPVARGFSLKAWVPPPYTRWQVYWARTGKTFGPAFDGAKPL